MKRRLLKFIVFGFSIAVIGAFLPVKDRLPHPKTAVVTFETETQPPVQLAVWWYDLGLNKHRFDKAVDFGVDRSVQVPDTPVPTQLWRLILKRVLQPYDKWTTCENCDGPAVSCSLRLKGDSPLADNMRLVQTSVETNGVIFFTVSLIPNEAKFEPREFKLTDADDLMTQARRLIAAGSHSNIPVSDWGVELTKINPVRIESRNSALILWMGDKIGYVIVPDSTSCPAFNMAFISGTEHPHVFKLEKI